MRKFVFFSSLFSVNQKQNTNFKNLNKMKKMIFSAVALVAFSVSGMANEEKDCKAIKEETLKVAEDITDCETAQIIANAAYKECVKQGGKALTN
jgi:putative hemolysin